MWGDTLIFIILVPCNAIYKHRDQRLGTMVGTHCVDSGTTQQIWVNQSLSKLINLNQSLQKCDVYQDLIIMMMIYLIYWLTLINFRYPQWIKGFWLTLINLDYLWSMQNVYGAVPVDVFFCFEWCFFRLKTHFSVRFRSHLSLIQIGKDNMSIPNPNYIAFNYCLPGYYR